MTKRIIAVGMAGITACAALLSAGCGKSGGGQAPPPPQVTVAQVLEKQVKEWDEFTGRLQAVETVEIGPACPATSTRWRSPKAAW